MNDLAAGFVVLGCLAVPAFVAGREVGRNLPVWAGYLSAAGAVLGLVAYAAFLKDDLFLAELLPASNLIIVGNWLPIFLSFLGGLAWSLLPRVGGVSGRRAPAARPHDPGASGRPEPSRGPIPPGIRVRRVVLVVALQAAGWYAVARPILGTAPRCHDLWQGDICSQTSEKTCSAACAATLLRLHGVAATEQEMADLCLTREGTLWQGIYRGLKLKTVGSSWDVEVFSGDFARLRSPGAGPAILAAGLPRHAPVPPIYTEEYGWTPGDWHSVLFFGFRAGGRVAMGEPTPGVGHEEWTEEDLRILWRGRGLRLVPRTRPPEPRR